LPKKISEQRLPLAWSPETQMLTGWTIIDDAEVFVCIPRDMIHELSLYNDAIESEIELHKLDIVARLKHRVLSQTS
jgi:hypothetical protein